MRKYPVLIGGHTFEAASYLEVKNPANGETVGLMPIATSVDLDKAVKAASDAFKTWSTTSDVVRRQASERIADVVRDNAEELAQLLTREQGKPLNGLGSRWEMGGAEAWTRYTAALEMPIEVLQDTKEGRVELHRKPIGVIGSITPWNFPVLIALWHIIPAIRAGNTVVIKPSPFTPLSTIRLVELVNAVLPAGVVNVVTGDDAAFNIGAAMSAHPGIAKITFTGSSATGKKIMSSASETLKRMTLELGGNDAGIVLPDADPKEIAEGLFWGAFVNNGQTCAALKRLYVHESVYDGVCEELARVAGTVQIGNGLDETSVLGPIQNRMQFERVRELVEDAKARGGRVLTGGTPMGGSGYFYPITLVADVDHGVRLVDEEQFGPALPIIRYTNLDEVIERANDNPNGLGGSVWSRNLAQAREVALKLQCGSVWINKHGAIQPNAPFGGVKNSGIGVSFGIEGLRENTSTQTIFC